MRKPQISLLAVSVSVASLLLASTSFAHENYKENYKGEAMPCPVELVLQDGLYVGAQAGYDNYRVVDEASNVGLEPAAVPTWSVDPRLAANGAVGGLFIGYGKYFGPDMYNAYLGLEIFGNWSAAKTDYELAVNTATNRQLFTTNVKAKDNFGIDALPGIKINNASLFYVRLGYNWAKVDINETYNPGVPASATSAGPVSSDLSNTNGGFHYGVGIESTFMPAWSVRAEYTHTGFGNNDDDDTGLASASVSDNQFMLGLVYHITI